MNKIDTHLNKTGNVRIT